VRVVVDLVIGKAGCFPPSQRGGGPMARRTSDVVDVTDYAARRIMRRGPAPPGGACWLAGVWPGKHAA